jgi:hypothetical protein
MRYVVIALALAAWLPTAGAQPDAAAAGEGSGSAAPAPTPSTGGPGTAGTGEGSAGGATEPVNPPTIEHSADTDDDATHETLRQLIHDVSSRMDPDRGFRFGSYGRVIAGTDLRGGKPERIAIVAHSPRIVEPSYLELETSYGFVTEHGVKIRPLVTLAFDGTLFHENGQFDAHPALRNMFVEAVMSPEWSAWVGSRMYRGDDIYLFDYWPLDDINTVGGGVLYSKRLHEWQQTDLGDRVIRHRSRKPDAIEIAAHAGENRLDVPFQFQQIDVADPVQGATTVTQLNRQRLIGSVSAAYITSLTDIGLKAKLHAEIHELGSGTFKRDDGTFEKLPADGGTLVGLELSAFDLDNGKHGYRRHLNLFTRYASGLASFDELAPPTSFGPDLKTSKASELTFGLSGNWDAAYGNMMLGALSRRFIDATGNALDPNNGWEYAVDARPLGRFAREWFAGADVSYQARFPQGLNRITLRAEDPAVFELAPMIVYSPMGPSAYDRPQLRLVYRAAHLNQAALDDYVPDDPRHGHAWQHFLGVQAEWWFNSSTYR